MNKIEKLTQAITDFFIEKGQHYGYDDETIKEMLRTIDFHTLHRFIRREAVTVRTYMMGGDMPDILRYRGSDLLPHKAVCIYSNEDYFTECHCLEQEHRLELWLTEDMVVKGDKLTDKDNAGAALLEACKEAKGLEPVEIGSYRGFTMSVTLENFGKDYWLYLKGNLSYGVKLGGDARGNLIRIENELSDLSWRLNTNKQQLQNVYNQMDIAKAELGKPFPQEAELRQKSARLTELNALLDMDGKGSKEPVVDGTIVAKSSRPSVLDKLKAPAVHGTPGKPHKIEKEAR